MSDGKFHTWSRYRVAFALIVFDAFTKAIAFHVFDAAIVNRTGLGGATFDQLFGEYNYYPICFGLSMLGSILLFSFLEQRRVRNYLKWVLTALSYPAIFLLSFAIFLYGGFQRPDHSVAILLTRAIFVLAALVAFKISHSRFFVTAFGLVFSGACGNFISFLYPPFKIIDFIEVPFTHGRLFNFADIYAYLGLYALCVSPIYYFVVYAKRLILSSRKGG